MDRQYCRKYGMGYYYYCPECAKDRERENKTRDTREQEKKRKWDEMVERTIWLPEVSNPLYVYYE